MIPTVTPTAAGKVRVTLGINPEDVYRLHREYLTALDTYHAPPGGAVDNQVRESALELAQSYQESLTELLCPEFDITDATALSNALVLAANDIGARMRRPDPPRLDVHPVTGQAV